MVQRFSSFCHRGFAVELHFMDSKNRLDHIVHCLVEYRKLWLLPAIVGVVLATVYAFFIKSETWTSRQTMIIRDDLLGQTFKPGSFLSEEAMKSAQETVLETARRPEVIRAALEKIGPSRNSLLGLGGVPSGWPSHSTIEDFRGSITFESANGGEFGKSEVIVLAAKTPDPERSVKFLTILMSEIDSKLSEIRASRFESMESELEATCESALSTRFALVERIKEMDASFGTNISTVQSMNESSGGNPSAFDNKLNQIRSDRRAAVSERESLKSFKAWLEKASKENSLELPTSRELLASQPALSELVTGLAKAKGELSEAEGQFQQRHPMVQKGREKVASMRRQIKDAIPATIDGLDGQIAVLQNRIAVLDDIMSDNADLLKEISSQRVPYAALARDLEKQTENYSEASARLAQVKSRKDASASTQLLTRIGDPWVGTRADGLGKRMLSLVGGLAGLIMGLGLVMIVAPPFVDPFENSASAATTLPEQRSPQTQNYSESDSPKPVSQEPQEVVQARDDVPVQPAPRQAPVVKVAPAVAAVAATAPVVAAVSSGTAPATPPAPPKPSPIPVVQIPAPATPAQASPAPEAVQAPLQIAVRKPDSVPATPEVVQWSPTPPSPRPSAPTLPSPTVEVVDISDTTLGEAEGLAATETEVPVESAIPDSMLPQQPALATPPPARMPRPASKTLAAIFANMPQPKTDASATPSDPDDANAPTESAETSQLIDSKIEALSEELKNTEAIPQSDSTSERVPSETIQLDGQSVLPQSAIPLQRRSSVVRPVDIAKADESVEDDPEPKPENIDSAFSQLEPPQPETPDSKSTLESGIQSIFRDED